MTTKFISLATGIVLLDVYLQSQLSSNDPLFLFASSNTAVNAVLLALAVLAIIVSFSKRFKHWLTFAVCSVLALACGVIGFIGMFFSSVIYAFPGLLMQLDYMFLTQIGVVLGICCLSYQHNKMPARYRGLASRPRLNNFAFPVLKTLQSPKLFRPGGAA